MCWEALSIGVATVANKKALFVTLVDRILRFDTYWSQFFAESDWFVVIKSHLDAYISRNGDFCANDNDDDTIGYFTPCACARGKNIMPGFLLDVTWCNIFLYSSTEWCYS